MSGAIQSPLFSHVWTQVALSQFSPKYPGMQLHVSGATQSLRLPQSFEHVGWVQSKPIQPDLQSHVSGPIHLPPFSQGKVQTAERPLIK